VLNLGCRWTVGDGRSIKVMTNSWLRGSANGRMCAPQSQGVYQISVNSLMIENERQWDVNKIMNLFSYDAAAQILAVPLVVEVQEDRLVWKEEQNGEYTVRSGYRLLMQEHEERVCREVKGDWRSLWQIRAPPKVKHLLWRICRDRP
jgi:hypothetical protein